MSVQLGVLSAPRYEREIETGHRRRRAWEVTLGGSAPADTKRPGNVLPGPLAFRLIGCRDGTALLVPPDHTFTQ